MMKNDDYLKFEISINSSELFLPYKKNWYSILTIWILDINILRLENEFSL